MYFLCPGDVVSTGVWDELSLPGSITVGFYSSSQVGREELLTELAGLLPSSLLHRVTVNR
jgi:hypothetical protein